MSASLRIVLDVNIWVANLLAAARARQGTTVQRIVALASGGKWHERDVQLVVSHEMLDTLAAVLTRYGAAQSSMEAYIAAIADIMRMGLKSLSLFSCLAMGASSLQHMTAKTPAFSRWLSRHARR